MQYNGLYNIIVVHAWLFIENEEHLQHILQNSKYKTCVEIAIYARVIGGQLVLANVNTVYIVAAKDTIIYWPARKQTHKL